MKLVLMTTITNEIKINAPVERVFEYYTNPDNIKESWPRDIVKESDNVSDIRNKEVTVYVKNDISQNIGKRDEIKLIVVEKEQNKVLIMKQEEGPYKEWESIQEFKDKENNS